MKTLKIMFALVIAAVILNACGGDKPKPTISWDGKISHFVEQNTPSTFNLSLSIKIAAEAGITDLTVSKVVYKGTATEVKAIPQPTGYKDQKTFTYEFRDENKVEDFKNGVTKIVYQFEVKDAQGQIESKEYTMSVADVKYTVTFKVKDAGSNNPITDAIVTLDGKVLAAGVYVIDTLQAGTHTYKVNKQNFAEVTGSFDIVDANKEIEVALTTETLLGAYTKVMICHPSHTDYATYNGTRVEAKENAVIGFKYSGNNATPANTAKVDVTTGCAGWVIVANDEYTTQAQLKAAYDAGTKITTDNIEFTYHAKGFAVKYYISKVGEDYILVKSSDAQNYATAAGGYSGSVLVFDYKK